MTAKSRDRVELTRGIDTEKENWARLLQCRDRVRGGFSFSLSGSLGLDLQPRKAERCCGSSSVAGTGAAGGGAGRRGGGGRLCVASAPERCQARDKAGPGQVIPLVSPGRSEEGRGCFLQAGFVSVLFGQFRHW